MNKFLREVGESVANLNTVVVGLDAVELGHKKPINLDISWSPADQKTAARKARRFVLESVLIRVSESVSQYIFGVSLLPSSKSIREKWEKCKRVGNAQRLQDISRLFLGTECYLVSGSCLLIHWRNRIVHSKSSANLTNRQLKALRNNEELIRDKYSNLDVSKLLLDFENKKPTLKDVSSLISMTINLVRSIDSKIGQISKSDLDLFLDYYDLRNKIQRIERETSPMKLANSIERLFRTEAPELVDVYLDKEK